MICVHQVSPNSGARASTRRSAFYFDGTKVRSVSYARLIAAIKLGRPLNARECAHHINGNPGDDACDNIEPLALDEHYTRHPHGDHWRQRWEAAMQRATA